MDEKRKESLEKSWKKQRDTKKQLCIWVTPEEHEKIKDVAKSQGMTLAAYIRSKIFN